MSAAAVLLWLWVICPPTVLYCPLKLRPPVFCTLMVRERAVIALALLIFTPSSSKKGWRELITVETVTPPFPLAGVTVRVIALLWLREPLVPVTVTVLVPVAAVLDALKVSVLVPLLETGLKLAVTPAGRLLAANATVPLNPFTGDAMMELVLVPPCATETLAGLAEREKSG